MLRSKPSGIEPNQNGGNSNPEEFADGVSETDTPLTTNVDIQQELNRLEEVILSSFRIPLVGRTLVDEEKLLEQLDFIRLSLPAAFGEAAAIIEQKEEIFLQAEDYGQQIVDAAQAKRAQILDESEIIREAEQQAADIQRKVQQECEAMMQETLEEIDHRRRQCQQELEQMRMEAQAQAQAIELGADEYADSVLENIEQQLHDMMRIVRNGRQQLQPNKPPKHK